MAHRQRSPLHHAAELSDFDMVKDLVQIGNANVTFRSGDDFQPLHAAHSPDIIRFLCQQPGVNVNSRNGYGDALLHGLYEVQAVATLLEDKRTDINLRTNENGNVLHSAVRYGTEELLRYLCALSDIEINVRDDEGDTPLKLAKKLEKYDFAEVLTSFGGTIWTMLEVPVLVMKLAKMLDK